MSTQPNIPESNIVPIALNVSAPIAPSLGVTKEALRRHTDVFQDPKNAGILRVRVCRNCQSAFSSCICGEPTSPTEPAPIIWRDETACPQGKDHHCPGQGLNVRLYRYLAVKKTLHAQDCSNWELNLTPETMRARMTLWNNPAPAVSVVTPSAVESIELSEPSVETSVQPAPSEIPAKPQPDLKEIKRAARLLFGPGDIVELRALNTGEGTISGLYDDLNELAQDTFDLSGRETTPNVYWTLQVLSGSLRNPDMNKCEGYAKQATLTGNADIVSYRLVFFDFDPDRPAQVSSTDAEKKLAYTLALKVRKFLTERGFDVILGDSGNGYHLLVWTNLACSQDNIKLVEDLLRAVSSLFSIPEVKIDTGVFNPGRICKAYGSVARKGEHTQERPWRQSRIVDAPENLRVATKEGLENLLGHLHEQLEEKGIELEPEIPVTAALDGPKIPYGQHDSQLTRIAGHLRQAKKLEIPEIEEILIAVCEARCEGYGPDYREMASKVAHSIGKKPIKDTSVLFGGRSAGSVSTGTPVPADASKLEQLKQEYNDVVAKAEESEYLETNPYPAFKIWGGTPYYDFAVTATGEGEYKNLIPHEFLINGLATVVGAIAGNRIVPEFNPELYAHFYTILLSSIGGVGKNEVFKWCKLCFEGTELLYNNGLRKHKNIGAFHGDFASARALIEKFSEYPSILQEYGEFSTAIEKFEITGSGTSFMDFNLNAYDSNELNPSHVKGSKLPASLPDRINNSMLAGTTTERWEKQASGARFETFMQRLNLVTTDETRTVFELRTPDVSDVRRQLMARVGLLEKYKLVWKLSPEAREIGKAWHDDIQNRIQDASLDNPAATETFGRIQVFVHRVISHLALFLAPVPTVDGQPAKPDYVDNRNTPDIPYVRKAEGQDKIWNVEVTGDMMNRAILAAEYLIKARATHQPPPGGDARAHIENLIEKWAVRLKYVKWSELKRRANLRRYSVLDSEKCLLNLERAGHLHVKRDPEDPNRQSGWTVVWVGDGAKTRKWKESRGGNRNNAGRKPKAE